MPTLIGPKAMNSWIRNYSKLSEMRQRAGLDFPVVKLLDYGEDWDSLAQNANPFAIVVMAHLKTLQTRHDPQERRQWKFALSRMLYERGYTRQDILELFRFIDWLMILPPGIEALFAQDMAEFEETQRMRYVTTIERQAEKRGLEQGLEQGLEIALRENILEVLEVRFTAVSATIQSDLNQITDVARLRWLFKQALVA